MVIFGDIMFFITSALVLSITCLVILLHVRAKDKYTMEFLIVLIPLTLQMSLSLLMNYLHQVLTTEQLTSKGYEIFCLWTTISSIMLTTVLLYVMSRYLVSLLPITDQQKSLGNKITMLIMVPFLVLSLFFIIGRSRGNWIYAMNLTFGYHFFSGSAIMIIHGIIAMVYKRKAIGRDQELLLLGISATFLPLVVTFPLDLIFFKEHSFKLAYLSFSIFVVFLYFFISGHYFEDFAVRDDLKLLPSELLEKKGISAREEEIVYLLIEGKTNREIAEQLFISTNTVKTHVKNIYEKLNVNNRVQLYSILRGLPNN